MAKEYVEREVISEGIRKYYYKNPPNSSYQEGFDCGLDKAQRVILNAPVVDVVEVRHGRWNRPYISWFLPLKIKNPHCFCTNCAYPMKHKKVTRFCPNCGALMDKEE